MHIPLHATVTYNQIKFMNVVRNTPPFPYIEATDKLLMFGRSCCANVMIFARYEPLPVCLKSKVVHSAQISYYLQATRNDKNIKWSLTLGVFSEKI